MTKTALQAAIYCRLSLSRYGDTTKVDEQERICRELAAQRGWDLAAGCGHPEQNGVYTDNSKSAWQKNRKRPAWDQMLADVDAGKLQAIIVYHGDRLVRQPYDLEMLLKLADGKGVRLASPTGTRALDNDDDQFILSIEAAAARRESAATSRRMKGDIARRARGGIVNSGGQGGRLFGFATDGVTHHPADRCNIATGQEVIEADIVREVIARILAGEGVRHITADLRGRGISTTAGRPMHPLAVRRMIASPRYAGLMPDGASPAAWQPIVPREDWETANAVMASRAGPLAPGHNARRYLLSGIARCGACGGPMQVLPAYAKSTGESIAARYGCLTVPCRKVFRKLEHLDTYVIVRTVAKLGDKRNPPGRIPSSPGLAAEFRALAQERQAIEAAVTDHTKGYVHLLLGRLESVDARLAQLRELTAAGAAARVTGAHAGINETTFRELPLSVQRTLVAALFAVTVLPASKRGPGFRTEDVRLTRPGHG